MFEETVLKTEYFERKIFKERFVSNSGFGSRLTIILVQIKEKHTFNVRSGSASILPFLTAVQFATAQLRGE